MTDGAKFSAPIGEPPAIQLISPAKLKVDQTYQRSLDGEASKKLVASIAERWDWRLCVPLLVAARGADLFIIDGQHRWAAAQLRGDIAFLPCAIGHYADAAEEARLFVAANRRRVPVNRLGLFRAALASGEPATVTIHQLLGEANLSLARHTAHKNHRAGEIATTAILYRTLERDGEDALRAILSLTGAAFGDQVITHSGVIIGAIAQLRPVAMDNEASAALLAVLRRRSANAWSTLPAVVRGSGGNGRAIQLFFAIREEFDRGKPATIPTRPPPPANPAQAIAGIAVPPPAGGKAWCNQCDRKVSPAEAASCRSAYCKANAA